MNTQNARTPFSCFGKGSVLGAWLMLLSLLGGCAAIPEQVALPDETPLVGFGRVIQAPEQYVGQTVRWGGVIAEVYNKADHSIIEITYYSLSASTRPEVDSNHSAGRFQARVNLFADPLVYSKGKAITVTGQLMAPHQGQIGEYNYVFPVINTQGHVLWNEQPDYDDRWQDPFYRPPYYRHPYYPYYGAPHNRPSPPKPVSSTKPVSGSTVPATLH